MSKMIANEKEKNVVAILSYEYVGKEFNYFIIYGKISFLLKTINNFVLTITICFTVLCLKLFTSNKLLTVKINIL